MKKCSALIASVAIASALLMSCAQGTDASSATGASSSSLSANQVSVVVTGVLQDYKGDLITSASIGFDNGDSPSVSQSARTLSTSSVNGHGQFELEVVNSAFTGGMTFVVKKDGYLPYLRTITLPTYATVSGNTYTVTMAGVVYTFPTNVTSTQIVETVIDTDNDDTNAAVYLTYDVDVGGFEVAYDIGQIVMYPLNGSAQGTILVVANASDGTADAVAPPEGSKVAFEFTSGTIATGLSSTIVYAVTDADGSFTFSPLTVAPNTAANPLPVFYANSVTGTNLAKLTIQAATSGGASDANGMAYLVISNTLNNLANLQVSPTLTVGDYNDFGTIYAVVDNSARVVGWTPQTSIDGVTVPMSQLDGNGDPSPITLTFSKALDPDTVSPYGVSFTATNWATTAASVSLSADGLSAVIVPTAAFPKGSVVNMDVVGWASEDGNGLTNPNINFTVENGIKLVDCSWLDDAMVPADVPYSTASYTLTFDQVPADYDDSSTFLYDVTQSRYVPVSISLNAAARTLTATPTVTLTAGDTYEIRYSVSSGVAGDPAATYAGGIAPEGFNLAQMRFTYAPEYSQYLVATNLWATGSMYSAPVSNTEFPIDSDITLTFYLPVQDSPAPVFTLNRGGTPVPVTVSTADNLTYVIDPSFDLIQNQAYTLSYTAYTTADGVLSNAGTLSFTSAAPEALTVESTNLYDNSLPVTEFPVTSNPTLTFSYAVQSSPAWTFTLTNTTDATTVPIGVTTADNRTFTVDPISDLIQGKAYSLAYTVYTSADGLNSATGTLTFATEDPSALVLVDTNLYVNESPATELSAATAAITLTFDHAVYQGATAAYAATYALVENGTSNAIDLTPSYNAAGTVATLTLASEMELNATYALTYTVYPASGYYAGNVLSSTITFSTAKGTLSQPILTVDANSKKINNGGDTDYDNGNLSFYIVATADTATTGFTAQYRYADESVWRAGTATVTALSGTTYYVTVTGPTLESGTDVNVRLVATAANYENSPVSGSVSFADTQEAPVTAVYFGDVTLDTVVTGAGINLALANNASTTADAVTSYSFAIGDTVTAGGSEILGSLNVTATGVTGATYSLAYNATKKVATLYVFVTKTADATTPTNPSGTIAISIMDASNNIVDVDPSTTAVDSLTLTL